jgi:hypothetical protein
MYLSKASSKVNESVISLEEFKSVAKVFKSALINLFY